MDNIRLHEMIINDPYLKECYELKAKLIGSLTPKILFNLVTEKMEYVHEDDNLKKIDELIEKRIESLKIK
jgi:hypothetical protein